MHGTLVFHCKHSRNIYFILSVAHRSVWVPPICSPNRKRAGFQLIWESMKEKEEGRLRRIPPPHLQNSHGNSCWRNGPRYATRWALPEGKWEHTWTTTISCFTLIHLFPIHPSLPIISFVWLSFFIYPFIPAHSLCMFMAEWFNPFLLIISPHSSGFCIHIFMCLFSSHLAINLDSFCERNLFPSMPWRSFLCRNQYWALLYFTTSSI